MNPVCTGKGEVRPFLFSLLDSARLVISSRLEYTLFQIMEVLTGF